MSHLAALFIGAVAFLAVTAPAAAFNASDCDEVPFCTNEYEWKHESTEAQATDFCKERYPTCANIDGRDMATHCKTAKNDCVQFIYSYLGFTTAAKVNATNFCAVRLPRCYRTEHKQSKSAAAKH